MRMPLATLQHLFDYHYNRRERVYRFLEQLTPEEFVQAKQVGWSSIRNTLVHSILCEEFWVQHRLQGLPRPVTDFEAYPTIHSVRELAEQVRARTDAFRANMSEEDLDREATVTYSSGEQFTFTWGKAFLHVITHDTHHRGQVLALARQMGYEPPDIDLL